MKKALIFLGIVSIQTCLFAGCTNSANNSASLPQNPAVIKKPVLINRQGPNSTGITQPIRNNLVKPINSYDLTKGIDPQVAFSEGGFFYITYKGGKAATNTALRVKYNSEAVAEGFTGDTGQALVSETILTTERISQLKNNQAKLEITVVIGGKDYPAVAKNIDFKSDKYIFIQAETDAPGPVEIKAPQKLNINCQSAVEPGAVVVMSDGSKNNDITWESSDEAIAGVKDGKITGLKQGIAILTASATAALDTSMEISVMVACSK